MKGCKGTATVVHHKAGRLGHKLHDQDDWLATCTSCNLQCEINDLEARSKRALKKKQISSLTLTLSETVTSNFKKDYLR